MPSAVVASLWRSNLVRGTYRFFKIDKMKRFAYMFISLNHFGQIRKSFHLYLIY